MKKETRISEFQKMYKAVTDKDLIDKSRRKFEREKRKNEKIKDTGI